MPNNVLICSVVAHKHSFFQHFVWASNAKPRKSNCTSTIFAIQFSNGKKKFIIFCCFKVSWSGCCGSVFLWYKPCDMHYFIQPKTSIYIYQVKSCQTLPVNVQLCLWKDNRLVCIMCCHALYMTDCSLCKFVCSHWCFAFVFNLSRRNIKALEIVIHDVHCDI